MITTGVPNIEGLSMLWRAAWAGLLAAASVAGAASAQEGAQLQEARAIGYVEAFNSGDADAYEAYLQEQRAPSALAAATPAERAENYAALVDQFGRLEVDGVDLPRPGLTRVDVTAAADGEAHQLEFGHTRDAERKLTTIRFNEGGGSGPRPPEAWADLAELLAGYREATGVPAWAAAVVDSDGVIDVAAAGVGRLGGPSVDPETSQFLWGSVGKAASGTVIGALVEAGVLDWDTTVSDIWPGHDMHPAYRDVGLFELMSHRAGLPGFTRLGGSFFDEFRARHPGDLMEQRAALAAEMLAREPAFPPGSAMRYSNLGPTIAGAMAEAATGDPWETLVRRHLFHPLGMEASGMGRPWSAERPEQTRGYFGGSPDALREAPMESEFDYVADLLAPAGGVRSTIGDFAAFARAHLRGLRGCDGPLDPDIVRRLHAAPRDAVAAAHEPYSYGWAQAQAPDGAVVHWHDGGAGFSFAQVMIYPGSDLAIVIMSNAGMAADLVDPLAEAIFRRHEG